MKQDQNLSDTELRSDIREAAAQGGSIEFKPSENSMIYQFSLRDLSAKGLGIIVRNDSASLNHLAVGQVLSLTLHQSDGNISKDRFQAEIRHISEPEDGQHPNHKIVGLRIIDAR